MGNITLSLPSVQSLLIELAVGSQPLSTGTGFVCESVKGPVLITNWHNLAGRDPATGLPLSQTGGLPDQVRILHNRANKLGDWFLRTEQLRANGHPRRVEHPTFQNKVDVVALPL